MKSRIERNLCPNCKAKTRSVRVGPSWQYVAATIILVAGAASIILLDTQDFILKLLLFIVFAILAFSLSSWGVEDQKKKALVLARKEEEK
ncbi:MAG: hypothetical protein ACE5QW_00295 [Thermoplasmata archaeon]